MPLTPAHAAAVVPLRLWKDWFWLSPLIVGSMAPDYIYFVFPPNGIRHIGHTPLGLVFFCVPVGLAVLVAFHAFFKRPLVLLMPRGMRDRLWPLCGPYRIPSAPCLAWISTLIYLARSRTVLWTANARRPLARSRLCADAITLFTALVMASHTFGLLQYASSAAGWECSPGGRGAGIAQHRSAARRWTGFLRTGRSHYRDGHDRLRRDGRLLLWAGVRDAIARAAEH